NSANAAAAEYKPTAKDRDKRMLGSTTVRTINSFGHRLWGKTIPHNLNISKKKVQELLSETIKELKGPLQKEASDVFWDVVAGVAMAKSIGYCPQDSFPTANPLAGRSELLSHLDEEPNELVWELIDEILCASIKQACKGLLDFNDQVYMPALFGGA